MVNVVEEGTKRIGVDGLQLNVHDRKKGRVDAIAAKTLDYYIKPREEEEAYCTYTYKKKKPIFVQLKLTRPCPWQPSNSPTSTYATRAAFARTVRDTSSQDVSVVIKN